MIDLRLKDVKIESFEGWAETSTRNLFHKSAVLQICSQSGTSVLQYGWSAGGSTLFFQQVLVVMVSLEELKNEAGSNICHENRDWVATDMRYYVFNEKTVTDRKICFPPPQDHGNDFELYQGWKVKIGQLHPR